MNFFSPHSADGAKCAKWYAVRVRSAFEHVVSDGMLLREIEHYLPTRWVMQRGKPAVTTMFPGYMFARLQGPTMVPVLEVPGVISVLGFGNKPEPISDAEIDAIRQVSLLAPAAQILPHICTGQRVRIKAFDFDGFEGVVARVDGRKVVAVNVQILGRSLAIDIAAEHLEIIRDTQQRDLLPTINTGAMRLAFA